MSTAATHRPALAADAWLERHREGLVAFLRDLLRTPSPNPPGECAAAADRVAREMAELGLDVERDEATAADGLTIPAVLGWVGPRTDRPALVLNAHVDTSPAGDGWTADPWSAARRDGAIWGRGAVLSKGDVAAYVHAAAAVVATAEPPSASALIAITADEGSGGELGPARLLGARGLRPERALCAGTTHQVTIAHAGCVQLRVRLAGTAIHTALTAAGTEMTRQVVAFAAAVFDEDARLRTRTPFALEGMRSATLAITRIDAGAVFGMAPGAAEVWLDRRATPDETLDTVVAETVAAAERAAAEAGLRATVEVVQAAEPLRPSVAQAPWARVVQEEASHVLGRQLPLGALPLYTDARWFGARGIPTVLYGAGPARLASAGVNGADEHVAEEDLAAATRVVARVVGRIVREAGSNTDPAGAGSSVTGGEQS